MKPLAVVTPYSPEPFFEKTLLEFVKSDLVEDVMIVSQERVQLNVPGCRILAAGSLLSQETLEIILSNIQTEYLLLLPKPLYISLEPDALNSVMEASAYAKAGIVYADFYDEDRKGRDFHPLNDYQSGSVRDDFDFGAMMLLSVPAVRNVLEKYGPMPHVKFAGLYALRLKVSIDYPVYHLNEPLYSVIEKDETSGIEKIFNYVDPRNVNVQKEMEMVFTDYLRKIGAYLPPYYFREAEKGPQSFPVEASVIIPVRNREATIAEAVKSALSQDVKFSFNIIVVDNHSTDGTTSVLSDLAEENSAIRHIIPVSTELGIGGCWNEAIYSENCGRYAVQLDSDDLYSSPHALGKIVHMLREGNYAMVIGSYTIVNFDLEEIPPGLIDHREWTDENGHNNALRINGLGAPRAFDTGLMRTMGFLNVSYGEDYTAALRICREYRIGRIYESLYLCRRWPGNTDAALAIVAVNRNDAFKDRVRTDEILARQKMNQEKPK
ncbi:MAG: glycosyltransferase family 2 protein [Proteobacteria bacterium]|nr:glycosyltransferase family 2 protein [Pseudomonadota bacterium]